MVDGGGHSGPEFRAHRTTLTIDQCKAVRAEAIKVLFFVAFSFSSGPSSLTRPQPISSLVIRKKSAEARHQEIQARREAINANAQAVHESLTQSYNRAIQELEAQTSAKHASLAGDQTECDRSLAEVQSYNSFLQLHLDALDQVPLLLAWPAHTRLVEGMCAIAIDRSELQVKADLEVRIGSHDAGCSFSSFLFYSFIVRLYFRLCSSFSSSLLNHLYYSSSLLNHHLNLIIIST